MVKSVDKAIPELGDKAQVPPIGGELTTTVAAVELTAEVKGSRTVATKVYLTPADNVFAGIYKSEPTTALAKSVG